MKIQENLNYSDILAMVTVRHQARAADYYNNDFNSKRGEADRKQILRQVYDKFRGMSRASKRYALATVKN